MSETETKTYGQVFVENLIKLREALETMLKTGITSSGLVMLLQAKTKMKKTEIKLVLDALRELASEMSKPYKP